MSGGAAVVVSRGRGDIRCGGGAAAAALLTGGGGSVLVPLVQHDPVVGLRVVVHDGGPAGPEGQVGGSLAGPLGQAREAVHEAADGGRVTAEGGKKSGIIWEIRDWFFKKVSH